MATSAEAATVGSTQRSPTVAAGLAIALYIVLIDAAVETFVSGSPVRWCVGGIIAAYLALSFGLWRYRRSAWEHMGWATRATESFFLLLALLAFTAWLPTGLTNGIRFLGQPTSRILSLLMIAAVLLAATSLFRLEWQHSWVRWVVGILAGYAVAAFLGGLVSSTSLPDLLHGESFWRSLPRWLQGSFAAVGLLGLALLCLVVNFAEQRMTISAQRRKLTKVGLMLSLAMVTAGFRAPTTVEESQVQLNELGQSLGPVFFALSESKGQPVSRRIRFQQGTRTIYAFLNVRNLKDHDALRVVWSKGTNHLGEQTATISELLAAEHVERRHYVWFRQVFNAGAAAGGYFVEISINGSPALEASFAVDPK